MTELLGVIGERLESVSRGLPDAKDRPDGIHPTCGRFFV